MAGNVSAASGALAVTIDTTAPAAPSAPDLLTASDSGVSSTDNITNVAKPTFTGTAEAGSTVTLVRRHDRGRHGRRHGRACGPSPHATLAAGAHSITAKATDVAGNVSAASAALSVTIDTTAPAAPTARTWPGVGHRYVHHGQHHQRHHADLHRHGRGRQHGDPVDGTTVIGTGVATGGDVDHHRRDPGGRSPQHHRQGDGCGRQCQRRIERAVGHRRHRGTDTPAFTGISSNGNNLTLTGTGDASTTVAVLSGTTRLARHGGTGGTWSLKFASSCSVRTLTAVGSDAAGNKSPTTSGSVLVGTSGANTLTSTAATICFMVEAAWTPSRSRHSSGTT